MKVNLGTVEYAKKQQSWRLKQLEIKGIIPDYKFLLGRIFSDNQWKGMSEEEINKAAMKAFFTGG